jgi:drug/metabolite transporter (DMT)-like permease
MAASAQPNRTLAAAAAVLVYATIIGYTDNYVRVIAAEGGLWQFHLTRSLMAGALMFMAIPLLGLRLMPRDLGAVVARSAAHGLCMLVYFGCLGFLSVAEVAAGLFTAPIFVLLLSRFVYGHALGPVRILAVAIGFAGVILVLAPGAQTSLSIATVLPVVAGALYALGNVATREWCAQESAATLTFGFFAALGVAGLGGLIVLAIFPQAVPPGAEGFVLRGWVTPSADFLFWTMVQAVGSMVGVGFVVRAYQLAEASRVAVFEYAILPAAAIWTYLIWDEAPGVMAVLGMVLIFVAGLLIALRSRQDAPAEPSSPPSAA